jgi:hypothetical protein
MLEGDGSRGAAEVADKSPPSAISAPPRANLFAGQDKVQPRSEIVVPLLDNSLPFRTCEVEDLQALAPICLNYFANTYPTLVQHRYLFSMTP